MLLNGIRRDLKERPADERPKIILFGESLGAWTSQDAFMGEGTDGFEALGIYKALWIGTPAGTRSRTSWTNCSSWKRESPNVAGSGCAGP